MLCQNCGNHEADFHYSSNVNGEAREIHLCSDCASKMDSFPAKDESGDYLGSMISELLGTQKRTPQPGSCPFCGTDAQSIRNSGKVGCAHCYDNFSAILTPYIRQIHGNGTHRGKLPNNAGESAKLAKQLDVLEHELRAAVAAEEYEKAAGIRDRLKSLKGGTE